MSNSQELSSLKRGLRTLTFLNNRGSATVAEVSRVLELPRTTAERVLMTLSSEGFISRDPQTKRYRLTPRVLALSDGFGDDGWIVHVATPLIFETTREIGWPLCIATPLGEFMSLRVTSDPATSLRLHRRHIGSEIPMSMSSSGIVYLAHLDPEQQRILLAQLAQSAVPGQIYTQDRSRVLFAIEQARANGYSFGLDHGRERSLSVPIMANGHVCAVLLLVFMAAAMTHEQVVQAFLPRLQQMALRIESEAFGQEPVA